MSPTDILKQLIEEQPSLAPLSGAIGRAYEAIYESYRGGGKLLLCGNGGSACDCEHIAGELMKGFLLKRPLTDEERAALAAQGEAGAYLSQTLQRALPAIVLTGLPGLSSAFLNDVDGDATYAQQAFAYARAGDVLIGISTSGNAKNVLLAAAAARARGAKVIGLTGEGGGKLAAACDILIDVPRRETYRVQELHLPIYHALCIMIESAFFGV
jgi:D-sedoheptulose 7-phosphate isomerase